eukprot:TRINITY_DN4996_c0_g1_i1.p1 TRINITY_DN4996_c0_g1~~TRINITY_DN4996_c0_g1_i1.p1  ORF type:complete len:294 (+),score=70.97 TRINITY_DN4996_c0_g1_i1:25-882(+)
MEGLKTKSVNELKVILRRANVDYSDCYEKSDLLDKIIATNAHLVPEGPQTIPNVIIGELDCVVVQNSSEPEVIVVISHGFGANAQDLVPIASNLILPLATKRKVKFVFPNAPLKLPQGGLAWWPIDLQALMMKFLTGQIQKIIEDAPPDFLESSRKLRGVVESLAKEHNLPFSQIIVGGFSQGAILSVDVCLKLDQHVGALVPWSAGYMNAVEWKRLAAEKKGLKVYQSHGTQDQIIPFQIGAMLKQEIFEKNGLDLTFTSFEGAHTIPNDVINAFIKLVLTINN